jgi:hypothetical protein
MTQQFVMIGNSYIRLDEITRFQRNKNGRFQIETESGIIGDEIYDFDDFVVDFIPVQSDWECLFADPDSGDTEPYWSEPVVAWGRTITGSIVPVTASNTSGVKQEFALRKVGDPRVYIPMHANYPDAESWARAELRTH